MPQSISDTHTTRVKKSNSSYFNTTNLADVDVPDKIFDEKHTASRPARRNVRLSANPESLQ
jgi:hypothetical protein